MKKIILTSTLALSLLLISFGIVSASNQQFVTLDKDSTVNSSYVRSGNSVTINGTVNGDVIVAGNDIVIDGTVNGNVYAAGRKIRVGGTVNGGLHLAAETVEVNANASGGSYIAGSNVKLGNNNKVGRGVYIAASEVTVEGDIKENVAIAGANIAINSVVGGDVSLAAGDIAFGDKAKVGGNFKYRSNSVASIQNDRAIGGSIVRVEDPQPTMAERVRDRLSSAIYWFVASCIIAFLVLRYAPKVLVPATSEFVKNPLNNAAKGAIFLFFVPIGLLMAFISVIGMPVAFLLGLVYVAVLSLAPIAAAFFIGTSLRKVSISTGEIGRDVYMATLLGLGIVALLALVPFLGDLLTMLIAIIGVGIIISRGTSPLKGAAPKLTRKTT